MNLSWYLGGVRQFSRDGMTPPLSTVVFASAFTALTSPLYNRRNNDPQVVARERVPVDTVRFVEIGGGRPAFRLRGSLLLSRSPSAIPGLVVTVVVDSVDGHARRALAHVRHELLKAVPR
jgi:hypothetical protein